MRWVFLIVYFAFVSLATASRYRNCWTHGHLKQRYSENGLVQYCETKEVHPQEVELGKEVRTRDCYQCLCTPDGLDCCGIGVHTFTGPIRPPEGCQILLRGCDYSFVSLYDRSAPCYSSSSRGWRRPFRK